MFVGGFSALGVTFVHDFAAFFSLVWSMNVKMKLVAIYRLAKYPTLAVFILEMTLAGRRP